MATSVPLIAQVPISAPTASRMKIAVRPVETLAIPASRRSATEWPRRQATKEATIAQKTSAIWFGPAAAASPKSTKDNPSRPTSVATGTRAATRPGGCGDEGRANQEPSIAGRLLRPVGFRS